MNLSAILNRNINIECIIRIGAESILEFLCLKGGCTGSSKSTHVKMPHCWKSPVMGSVGRTLDWGSGGADSSLTAGGVTVLHHWARDFIRCLVLVQDPSWHEWKFVDWDIKNQTKQKKNKKKGLAQWMGFTKCVIDIGLADSSIQWVVSWSWLLEVKRLSRTRSQSSLDCLRVPWGPYRE